MHHQNKFQIRKNKFQTDGVYSKQWKVISGQFVAEYPKIVLRGTIKEKNTIEKEWNCSVIVNEVTRVLFYKSDLKPLRLQL